MSLNSSIGSSNDLQVRVVIPARNEAEMIESALDALRGQVDLTGAPLQPGRFDVTVLAHNCEDETAEVVRAYGKRFPAVPLRLREATFPIERATIGTARRTLIDEACERFEAEARTGIVASTDADTIVAPDWIVATMAEFDNGSDAVGGRIEFSAEGLASLPPALRQIHLDDTDYRIMLAELGARVDPNPGDPFPGHHQYFGASLAVRSDVYRRAGGIPEMVTQEDLAFFEALERIDATVRHSPTVRATTSVRWQARVPTGLSTNLEEWAMAARAGRPVLVESVTRSLKRLQLRREFRDRWRYRRMRGDLEHGTRMDAFAYFGAFLAEIRSEIEQYLDEFAGSEPVTLTSAIDELRGVLSTRP